MFNKFRMFFSISAIETGRRKYRKAKNTIRTIARIPSMSKKRLFSWLLKLFKKRDPSFKDYWEFKRYYVSKRFVLIMLLSLLGLIKIGDSYFKGSFSQPETLYLTDEITYTGDSEVYDNEIEEDLIYEGTLKDGYLTGNGIQYYDDTQGEKIKYRGGFQNNLYSGYGQYYTYESLPYYAGNFVDGKYEGNGILLDYNNYKLYHGAFAAGYKAGKGIFYQIGDSNVLTPATELVQLSDENLTLIYVGDFSDNAFNGNGSYIMPYGTTLPPLFKLADYTAIYTGVFKNDRFDGAGQLYYTVPATTIRSVDQLTALENDKKKIRYNGDFSNNAYNGTGMLFYSFDDYEHLSNSDAPLNTIEDYNPTDFIQYNGNFLDGKYHGAGKAYFVSNKTYYDGNYVNDKFSGNGTEFYDNETNSPKYVGTFKDNIYNGSGSLYEASGPLLYEGEFKTGLFEGYGVLYKDQKTLYSGDFLQNRYNGTGILYHSNEAVQYEGEFADSHFQGFGTLYDDSGNMKFKGYFVRSIIALEEYFNKTEDMIQGHFGVPDIEAHYDGDIEYTYESPSIKFVFNYEPAPDRVLTHKVQITEPFDIMGVNTTMTASEVEKILDRPDKRTVTTEDGEQIVTLTYASALYDINFPFKHYETEMQYIEVVRRYAPGKNLFADKEGAADYNSSADEK